MSNRDRDRYVWERTNGFNAAGHEQRQACVGSVACPVCGSDVELVADTEVWMAGEGVNEGKWLHSSYGPGQGVCCGKLIVDSWDGCRVYGLRDDEGEGDDGDARSRPTNPNYTGSPHPDPRVHGPEICPHRCGGCVDGRHHWMENGFDSDEPYYGSEDDPGRELHRAIKAAGPTHAESHYACKHCSAWCECEFIWEQEGRDGDEDDDDTDPWDDHWEDFGDDEDDDEDEWDDHWEDFGDDEDDDEDEWDDHWEDFGNDDDEWDAEDFGDDEPTGSCDICGVNIYPDEDDGSDLCPMCQWYAEHGGESG